MAKLKVVRGKGSIPYGKFVQAKFKKDGTIDVVVPGRAVNRANPKSRDAMYNLVMPDGRNVSILSTKAGAIQEAKETGALKVETHGKSNRWRSVWSAPKSKRRTSNPRKRTLPDRIIATWKASDWNETTMQARRYSYFNEATGKRIKLTAAQLRNYSWGDPEETRSGGEQGGTLRSNPKRKAAKRR